jgi:anti-anti-sigma factor
MLQVTVKKEPGKATLQLSGRFNFESHAVFKNAYSPLIGEGGLESLVIDFGRVDYIDSSALGMLLMVRDKLTGLNQKIVLANSGGAVREVLQVANFGKIFNLL